MVVIFITQLVCNSMIWACNGADILLSLCFQNVCASIYACDCLADVVFVIPCSEFVCGGFLSLLDVWLILCLSFLALSKYVVVFCPCWMSG